MCNLPVANAAEGEKNQCRPAHVPNIHSRKWQLIWWVLSTFESFDGNQYILTCMDMLTSWVEAIPFKLKDTKLVGRLILDHIICQFGCPEEIISDNEGEFCSKVIDEICSELSIRRIKTAPYHAQANGKLENFHKLLISSIKKNIQHDA